MIQTDVIAAVLVLSSFGIGLLIDVYLIWRGGIENSISFRVTKWSKIYPIIPAIIGFAIGMLFGHFWWVNTAFCK